MLKCWEGFKRARKTWNFKTKAKKTEKITKIAPVDESQSQKTPASILYEILAKKGKYPVYEMISEKPLIPFFTYRVSCDDKSAEGSGRSKKKAKQAAAEAFIYNLIYKVIAPPESPSEKQQKTSEDKIERLIAMGNFVGALQEFCRSWKMSNPVYHLEMEIGSLHAKQYFVSCVLHDRRTFGSATKKKAAKQTAAEEMWEEVHLTLNEDTT